MRVRSSSWSRGLSALCFLPSASVVNSHFEFPLSAFYFCGSRARRIYRKGAINGDEEERD